MFELIRCKVLQIGIRAVDLMGPPTVAQRLELLEEKLAEMEVTTKDFVTKAVDRAMEAMRHSLTEVLMEGQSVAAKQMGADFEALTGRLEGRVNRSREYHETLINAMRTDHLKFQAEMKSTLTGCQSKAAVHGDKAEGSVNRGDVVFNSPNSNHGGVIFNSTMGVFGDDGKGVRGRDWNGGYRTRIWGGYRLE